MQKMPIGRTGVEVTQIAFGCSSIGNMMRKISDEDAEQVLKYAWSKGIRYFDTAPHYGRGLSELRLGHFLRHQSRDDYVISSKVGRLLSPGSQLAEADGFVAKTRAYAIFTLPVNKALTKTAERRLRVLQSLDMIGAGFELASHDLDIRGSGNLLGEEQSGQIREVGYELYQQMLEEAVAELKDGDHFVADEKWSPQISIGTAVLIPESYVPDLQLRLGLYRRLSDIREPEEIDAFGAEMIDRFGPLPEEVEYLLKIVYIKGLCLTANVEKLDTGPKGAVISFRNNDFPAATQLVSWLGEQGPHAKIRPDQSVFLARDWETPEKRLKGSAVILAKLAGFVKELDNAA